MHNTAQPLVQLERVEKKYANRTIAVQDANLLVREGEFISFVGPSGCGKSTILRMIAGLSEPSGGNLQVMGGTADSVRKSGRLAYVFQDATLMPWCNVLDNVALPLELKGISRKQRTEESLRVLELVGLKDYSKSLPRELSGGMKMRVSIARSLVAQPDLLLMDEPFGALDELTRQTLQQELLGIWSANPRMTVLFVTHNVFEAVYLSTRIAVMTPRPGRIVGQIDVHTSAPRQEDFRTSPQFNELASRVNAVLRH
ncbi:ABC transporter ATP-binding protein [Paenibacillus periandrae]|uniref:ABC transporter ATP-binding protein n=1 Tax=Paenibacillus periandrae TaxID=1761741 RepID=UPI001F08AC2F|nr:ABC transporter ATP-binding protein [Paenibacillus periandrae]